MDIGDLIFLIFIALGGLSSVLSGKKKKKKQQSKPKPRPRPDLASDVSDPPPSARRRQRPQQPARLQAARRETASQMERILQELGLGVQVEEEKPGHDFEAEVEPPRRYAERELPKIVSLEETTVDAAKRHDEFHDKYVKPLSGPKAKSSESRAGKYVNSDSLREAILRQEILGPPKGLQ